MAAPDANERRARRIALSIALPYLSLGILDVFYIGWLSSPPWLYWTADILEDLVLGLLLLWAILRLNQWRLDEIGFARPPGAHASARLLAYCVAAGVLLASPVTDHVTSALGVAAPVGEGDYDYGAILSSDRVLRVAGILYLCTAASFLEEIFYRGVLWRAIAPAGSGVLRQACFVLVSAAMFGASHTEQGLFGVVSTGLWGGLCAVLLLAMRSLWPLIFGHFVTNLYQFRHELLG